jgi:23S rRNA pseudouridine1911/1915/1917 synthase
MDIKIIYEDEDIVAIDKPPGMLVHPDGHSKEETVSDWVAEKYPEAADVGEPMKLQGGEVAKRPGIVHRIDKETSGVLLIAKNKNSFELLKSQFQNREVKKVYRSFVWGNFNPSASLRTGEITGIIDKPIGRSSSDFRKKSAERGIKGTERPAVTEYKVLRQATPNNSLSGNIAYLEVYPQTGRTHQIRVHLKSISRPVVADSLYAPGQPLALGFERLALHAYKVSFKKMNGEFVTVEAPLPQDFVEAEKALQSLE